MGATVVRPASVVPFAASREGCEQVVEFAASQEASEMSESELERELEQQVRELKRQLLQDHLDHRQGGGSAEPVLDAEGRERTSVRSHQRTLVTTFGPVKVDRFGYGGPGLESLHPLDGSLNLPSERYSLEMRRQVARQAARGSFEEAVEAVKETTGVTIGKRQAEQLAQRAAVDFDDYYAARQAEAIPESSQTPVLVLSIDGKGIVMRREDLRAATQRVAESRQHKLSTRLSKGEKRGAKRMASVATVYGIDRYVRTPEEVFPSPGPRPVPAARRPRPQQKRVWASLENEVAEVVEEMFQEAASRDPQHALEWVALVDGNEHQLRLLRRKAKEHEVEMAAIVVDVIHVLEYVWKAGLALQGEGTACEEWMLERMQRILAGKASLVAAGMRRSATLRDLEPKERAAVDRCADYLLKYKRHLRYDHYLSRGYPIATGVVEGACRHLVNLRMNRSGARWSLTGAEAVLRLRALVKSGDFDDYWPFHEQRELERNHLARYADEHLPKLHNPASNRRGSHLHLVE
ncbi:MAG: ISKra4 family transposase [Gammaproteobacteria bacterium]|nr:ISKra4 family transposase [Gammaproteobacteria bacterium]